MVDGGRGVRVVRIAGGRSGGGFATAAAGYGGRGRVACFVDAVAVPMMGCVSEGCRISKEMTK